MQAWLDGYHQVDAECKYNNTLLRKDCFDSNS